MVEKKFLYAITIIIFFYSPISASAQEQNLEETMKELKKIQGDYNIDCEDSIISDLPYIISITVSNQQDSNLIVKYRDQSDELFLRKLFVSFELKNKKSGKVYKTPVPSQKEILEDDIVHSKIRKTKSLETGKTIKFTFDVHHHFKEIPVGEYNMKTIIWGGPLLVPIISKQIIDIKVIELEKEKKINLSRYLKQIIGNNINHQNIWYFLIRKKESYYHIKNNIKIKGGESFDLLHLINNLVSKKNYYPEILDSDKKKFISEREFIRYEAMILFGASKSSIEQQKNKLISNHSNILWRFQSLDYNLGMLHTFIKK